MKRKILSAVLVFSMVLMTACGSSAADSSAGTASSGSGSSTDASSSSSSAASSTASLAATSDDEIKNIETTLNLANNTDVTWSYDSGGWIMSIVPAVVNPELPDEQGVSVCVPGAYVKGIDANADGTADVTADNYSAAVNGTLVIDNDAEITSTNGQVYKASTAPIILNTGAAGYSSSNNSLAATTYVSDGYINVACGNRGKQDTATDASGNSYYTGDAPCCLVDQKDAARFVKYNILLGNLPGNVNYLVSTGGSGGAAHAAMFAATSNSEDFYDYEIEAGAVGVYRNADGTYSTSVTVNGKECDISDGAWGCVAYSAITPLYEADMDMAFEYDLDKDYSFNTSFQKQMAKYLSKEYMDYINGKNLSVRESAVGFDLNGDGDKDDTVDLTIEYDESKYADTNGYGGTYLNLYLAELTSNLQWYLDNLDYADDWTWFDESGSALSDAEVAAMTMQDKEKAFLEGRYAKSTSSGSGPGGAAGGAPGGSMPGGMSGASGTPGGSMPSDMSGASGAPGGSMSSDMSGGASSGSMPGAMSGTSAAPGSSTTDASESTSNDNTANQLTVGTPGSNTTQASGSAQDSANYSSYADMLAEYQSDIEGVYAGDKYGNNIVELYNPLNYIGSGNQDNPAWTRIVMGASEGDMSMFASLNMQIAWLNAGVDADIEWQWNGGHVPSEIFGESLALYVDQMYGKYVDGAVTGIKKAAAAAQTTNGDATEATGTDITSWVNSDDLSNVSVTLAAAAAYRVAGASKATPGFDVMDYGQEDYVFGDSTKDARHWDQFVLTILQDDKDDLESLFNAG